MFLLIFRPPDIVIGGLRFYRDSSFFLRHLLSELIEQSSTKTGHMHGSECDLEMHVQNLGHTLPLKIGGPTTTLFDDFAT